MKIEDGKNHRFGKNKSISFNPPSSILHVSNIKEEACNYDVIEDIFKKYGNVQSVKLL